MCVVLNFFTVTYTITMPHLPIMYIHTLLNLFCHYTLYTKTVTAPPIYNVSALFCIPLAASFSLFLSEHQEQYQ